MKERMIPSTCPHCGHGFQIKRDTMAIAGMNPIVDQRLYEGTYFTHRCSQCHQLYYLEQPFLYHDPDRKYVLILSGRKHISNLPEDEEVIRCKNAIQFLFCFRVLSQNLNVRLILQKKQALEARFNRFVTFDTYDAECLWFKTEDDLVAVHLNRKELRAIRRLK